MNKEHNFLLKQRADLEEEKKRIEERIKKLKKYPEYGSNEEDNIQELSDYESNLSIEEQLAFLLGKIKRALKAIDDKTYGVCASCKEKIESGRLEIMPYAELCVTCSAKKQKS